MHPTPDTHNMVAAIFDFDGTLADTAGLWHDVDIDFLGRRGIVPDSDYSQRLAALGFAAGAQYTIERYGLNETVEDICAEWKDMGTHRYRSSVTLRPGALEYVTHLRDEGIPCALATTNDAAMLEVMEHVDVNALFDVRVYRAEVARGKDHPDIYLETARRLGVGASSCLVFEDIAPAIYAARSVGMSTCGVRANDVTQPVETIRNAADYWIDDWRDLT
jgi:HAD superfamily hydrolase (TIGR01509 family)